MPDLKLIQHFERPNSVISGDKENWIQYDNKPLHNIKKNKPELRFLLRQL